MSGSVKFVNIPDIRQVTVPVMVLRDVPDVSPNNIMKLILIPVSQNVTFMEMDIHLPPTSVLRYKKLNVRRELDLIIKIESSKLQHKHHQSISSSIRI